jgi:hypothetical protein
MHTLPDNTSKYTVAHAPASVPGGMALAGYAHIRQAATYPEIPSGMLENKSKYIDKMFFVTFSCFKEGGALRPFVEAMLASLVQYYNAMRADGLTILTCPVMKKLFTAVMEIEDLDPTETANRLRLWSEGVQTAFTAKNAVAIGCANSNDDILDYIKSSTLCMTQMLTKINSMSLEMKELKGLVASVSDSVIGVSGQVEEATTPRKQAKSGRSAGDEEEDEEGGSSSSSSSSSSSADNGGAKKSKKIVMLNSFDWQSSTTASKGKTGVKTNSKWPTIPNFLEHLANEKNLKGMGTTTYHFQSEFSNVKRTMQHVKKHITTDEMEILEDEGEGDDENARISSLKTVCMSIYSKAKTDILTQLDEQEGAKQKNGGSWTVLSMSGMLKKIEKKRVEAKVQKRKEAAEKQRKEEAAGRGEDGGQGEEEGGGSGEDIEL